jgi:hypothetical protein
MVGLLGIDPFFAGALMPGTGMPDICNKQMAPPTEFPFAALLQTTGFSVYLCIRGLCSKIATHNAR